MGEGIKKLLKKKKIMYMKTKHCPVTLGGAVEYTDCFSAEG